ncbi:competence/damage-inducible protein A [Granulosicoccaceae sp. 1_MG-2023]|nr:competence/damage-inducible protein A [Granulosicoccaceae sp. 1_MG-2023]
MKEAQDRVTAAAILIGNELLSGSVVDKNMHYIACKLVGAGIVLTEVRVIPDDCAVIAATVREMRSKVDYVFTTGGIGPTHDDITAECVAQAFDRPLIQHPETAKTLRAMFAEKGVEANAERMRMANMPEGAEPLKHQGSPVPGFRMENVYVLAGVPSIMRSMLDAAVPGLRKGKPVLSQSVRCDLSEGTLAHGLKLIQEEFAEHVDIGSYPLSREENFHVRLVIRGTDSAVNGDVAQRIKDMIGQLGGQIIPE